MSEMKVVEWVVVSDERKRGYRYLTERCELEVGSLYRVTLESLSDPNVAPVLSLEYAPGMRRGGKGRKGSAGEGGSE